MKKLIKIENLIVTTKQYDEAMRQNIELVNQCQTEEELTELLNTGTKKTIDFVRAKIGASVQCRLSSITKAEFVKLCVIAIMGLRENEKFKTLSFDEQIVYLQSVFSDKRFVLMKFMDIAKMKTTIYEAYPEQAEQLKIDFNSFGEHLVFCWFERRINHE